VHGRTLLLALSLTLACLLPAAAAASPMPAGTYDVQLTAGSLDIGNGVLPALPLTSGTSFSVAIGTTPVSAPIGLTVVDGPVNINGVTGTASVTVTGAGATLDPADGSATVEASFYMGLTLSGSLSGIPVQGTCTLGSQASPINVHLTTAKGSAWDSTTNAFSMVDDTFALPTPVCSPSLVGQLLTFLVGSTNTGDNTAILNGTAKRQADPPPTNTTAPVTTSQAAPASGGGTIVEITPSTAPPPPAPAVVKACIVPKLVGKNLKQAKRALKKAGCKAGKAKSTKSKKKKGRILKQRYKTGTKLPAGTKIPLTVSRGEKKARSHRSR
jgi:hypothetical protein